MNTNKEFSEGFRKDIADLIEICAENESDHCTVYIPYEGTEIEAIIMFRSLKKGYLTFSVVLRKPTTEL